MRGARFQSPACRLACSRSIAKARTCSVPRVRVGGAIALTVVAPSVLRVGDPASVTNCLFNGNIGLRGGAVSCISDSSLGLAHCTISGNHADATGGGVFVSGSLAVTVKLSVRGA